MHAQEYLALAALAARSWVVGGEHSDLDNKFSDRYDETRIEAVSSSASSHLSIDIQRAILERFATRWEAIVEQLVSQGAIVTSVSNVSGAGKLILIDQALARHKSIETLGSYRGLRAGWNGKGSTSFDGELIDNAIEFVKKLEYQPEIFPTGRDSIQFEYHTDWGYLEVEMSLFDLSVFIETEKQQTEKEDVSVEQAITMIRDFHAQR